MATVGWNSIVSQELYFISNETLRIYRIDLKSCEINPGPYLKFPSHFELDHRQVSSMVFHPDGHVYITNGRHLMRLDLVTGLVEVIFAPNPSGDIYWLGMTIDSLNQLLIGFYNLNSYDPLTNTYTSYSGGLTLSNFTTYKGKILANRRDRFEFVDIYHKPLYSLIKQFEIKGLSEMTALTTYHERCNKQIVYGVNHSLDGQSYIFEIDAELESLDTICQIPVNLIVAMGSPKLYQDPNLQPDIDVDNSSGHTGNGFWTSWDCNASAKLTDDDIVLNICDKIDSILIESEASIIGEDLDFRPEEEQYIWENSSDLDSNQIKNWLRSILARAADSRSESIVKIKYYSNGSDAETWTLIDPRTDLFVDDSTTISLCKRESTLHLDSILIGDQEVRWNTEAKTLDLEFDSVFTLEAIRTSTCPDTTVVMIRVRSNPLDGLFSDTTLCPSDSLVILTSQWPGLQFGWEDFRGVNRVIDQPGSYSFWVSTQNCLWEETLNIVDEVDCDCPFYVPNAFTPNDDGTNDQFMVFSDGCLQVEQWQIFDRWGNLVFQTNSREINWNGDGAPVGTYVYILDYYDHSVNEHKRWQGSIQLIR